MKEWSNGRLWRLSTASSWLQYSVSRSYIKTLQWCGQLLYFHLCECICMSSDEAYPTLRIILPLPPHHHQLFHHHPPHHQLFHHLPPHHHQLFPPPPPTSPSTFPPPPPNICFLLPKCLAQLDFLTSTLTHFTFNFALTIFLVILSLLLLMFIPVVPIHFPNFFLILLCPTFPISQAYIASSIFSPI